MRDVWTWILKLGFLFFKCVCFFVFLNPTYCIASYNTGVKLYLKTGAKSISILLIYVIYSFVVFFLHSLLWFGFLSTQNPFKGGQQMALELKASPGWDAHWPAEKATMRTQMQMQMLMLMLMGGIKSCGGAARSATMRHLLIWKVPVMLWRVEPWGLKQEPGGKTSFGSIEVLGASFCICQAIG